MLKNLKRASAIMLSLAMAVQFGMADTYFANTLSEEPIIEETQEQEPVTVEEGSQQVAVEQTEAPAIDAKEEFVQVPETKSVTLSYVAEDGTILRDATTHEYEMGYSLNSDASVMLNFDGYTLKDVVMNDSQIVAAAQANLNVTSDLTSVKFVYQKVMTESHPEANEAQEENKTEEKTEEDAEADPEAKEELPEYPAFDMSATAGNVTVHVTAAEGVLPSGAQLIVKRVTRKAILNAVVETVTEKDKEVDSAIALDITIVNADGIEIQPNGIVNVSFENVAVGGEEVNVYHVTDDASTVTEVATNTQSFDANHFSIYVITGEKKVELTTFNFVANEQNVSTQIVKTGDTLITPTAPDIAGKAFVEWQENGSKFDGFGVQTITKTETRTITAKYEDALYVYFYNPEGTKIMRTEKVADHKDHNYSHVSYDVDATHKLVGWAADQNGTTNIANSIAVPEGSTSVNVYAIIKEGYWVTFDSDGGSAIDSQFVFDKISLNDQTTPTKPGYTFGGWYNGSTKVENGTQITKPMTLKAHWTPKQVSYTVIHWWENADDDGYSFHESQELQGLTGKTTEAVAKSYTTSGKNIHGESVTDKVFTASTISQKTIKGDGSTIVNVYYKRKTYTMHFKERRNSRKDLSTITKKWGQSISKKEWPTYDGNGNWQIASSKYLAFTSSMPMKDSTLWSTSGYYTYKAYYYVQKIDGNGYNLHHTDTIKMDSNPKIGNEDCYAIAGFAYSHGDPGVGGRYKDAKFYYTRNSYKIRFINNGKEDKSVEKKYEQSISSENYTPTRPSSLPEYYVFDGWYENELCEGKAFDFSGKKMPAQNVTLYAKWTASDVKLTYNLNNPEGALVKKTEDVAAGTVASTVLPSIPTINEYSFAGWYYADGNGNITSEVFNTNNTITRDTSIVGKWLYKGELRVVYNPGTEKDATVPTDSNIYAGGARVTVAGNATTTSGKKFLGWELNGNVYKPGQSFEVNKDIANKDNQIILTATWGNAETSTTLTYNPGNGRGNLQTVNVMNNEAVEIEAHGSLGFSAPVAEGKEYYFAGWADSKTGNATYADGQTINIDANGENVLYAVWVEKAKITVVAKSDEVTYDGNNHVVDGFNSLTIDGYTVSGLSASVSGTDAGTYNNVITGKATVTKDGKDVTDRVVVTKQNGTLTINKRQVTLTSEGGSKPYDGTALTKPDVAIGGDGFVNGEVKDIKATGSVTNVSDGEVTNTITYTPSEKFNKNNYQITKTEGKLSITAVEAEVQVQIVGATDTVGYDGHEHRVEGYTVTINNDKYHEADFTFSGNKVAKGINAGTYNMELAVEQFKNNSSNFSNVTFTVTDGYLVITPKSINTEDQKITVSDPQGHVYDGNPHQEVLVVRDAELDKTLKSGKDYDVYYSTKDFTNVGEITITITGKGNYVGTVNKTYSITKRTVTLSSETASKPYDGTPLTRPNVKVEGDGFITGEVTSVQAIGTVTEVKDSPVTNAIEYTVGTKFNINNYEISMTEGTLSITPKSINPDDQNMSVSDPQDHVYDGLEHKEELEVKDIFRDVILSAGIDYDVEYSTKDFTNVGKITITITGKGNYTGTFDRTYEITPATLTVTTPSANKVYDGTPLTAEGTISGFVNKETATFTTTGSQTEVGSSSNTYSIEWNGTAKSSNYKISETVGTLTVTENENEIVVTTKHSSYTYDGLAHGTEVTVSNLPKGYSLDKATSSATATDVTTAIEATCDTLVIKNAEGKDVTNNLKITKVPGSITITPATLTVTTPSANKVYDGTPLTADGTISGFVNKETATFTTTGSQTEVGNSKNTYSIKWNGTAKSTNYQISEAVGTLTVTQQSIDPEDPENNYNGVTINNPSNSVYDGKEHKWSPAVTDKEGNALVEGTDYEVTYSTSDFRNVTGTITVTITGIGNYTGKVTRTYEITPKAYTVTTESANKVYDGTALTAGGKIEGIVSGETVEFTTTGSRTDEGTSKNTYSLKWNGSAIETNYKLAKESIGDLAVTPKSIIPDEPDTPDDKKTGITVSNPKDSKYDGQEHREVLTVKDTKTGKDLIANKDYTVVYSDDLVNAGTVTIKVSGLGNYRGSFTKTYKITKRLVTLTSATVSKTYDGQALTNTSITVSGDGFVEGEGASYEVTGTQTSVGNSANAFEYKLNEKTLASNYDITKVVGTLTITAAPAPVTPPTSPTPVSPPPVTPRYIQKVVPALTPQEEVKKEKTPKAEPKEEKVEKEKTPKARPEKFWALINLICAIVTVLFGLLLLISKRHKNKDDEEEDDETKQQTNNDDESKEQEKKRGAFTRVLAVLIAILSVVFFLVTEDLSLRWTWTDQWTIWMVVIGFVQIVVFFVGRKWKNVDDDEDEQAQQA
ncbi:InlB B-repeat-containing protein [Holdemanella porci]|uniref:InlB B-repeat-containing protein n=1 Tax=Holdemanella porci TaxID=2652276 RepID=UPI003AEFD71D